MNRSADTPRTRSGSLRPLKRFSAYLAVALLVGVAGWLLAVNYVIPEPVFRQEVGAGHVSQGITMGPFYMEPGPRYSLVAAWEHPETGEVWETNYRFLDSNRKVIDRRSEFGAPQGELSGESGEIVRTRGFRLDRDADYYYLDVQQTGGVFSYLDNREPAFRLTLLRGTVSTRRQLLIGAAALVIITGLAVYARS